MYLNISKALNKHFLDGTFTEGLSLVPYIEGKLQEYWIYLDRHRILVFYYKIACLYFGSGDYGRTIDYLNKIINWKVDLRTDLQCYSRLLHLIAHYELGNFELLEYLDEGGIPVHGEDAGLEPGGGGDLPVPPEVIDDEAGADKAGAGEAAGEAEDV